MTILDFLAAGGITLLMVLVGLFYEHVRSTVRSRQVRERVHFEQKRLDLLLMRRDPDAIGTLDSFKAK
jgi:hypothetical protein